MPSSQQSAHRPAPTDGPAAAAGGARRPRLSVAAFLTATLLTSVCSTPEQASDGWKVVRSLSAHRVLVVEVETSRPQQAKAIAVQLVEPQKSKYAEVMVYIYRPGRRRGPPARRVQWSPRGGYVETVYEEAGQAAPRPS